MHSRLLWSVLLTASLGASLSSAAPSRASFDHSHEAWTRLLKAYVYDGMVSYTELPSDEKAFNAYLASLTGVTPAAYKRWSEREQMAYWINVHNAFAIKLILDNFPVDSIRSIRPGNGAAMRKQFIPVHVLGPQDLSLQEIQQEVLGKRFHDARVHFALTPGTLGAPQLRNTAYRADALDSQLEDATYRFITDQARNAVDVGARTMKVSMLFQWFQKDLTELGGSLPGLFSLYVDDETAEALRTRPRGFKIEFQEYDWSLNGR